MKEYGIDGQKAEEAWLEAVWLWPDIEGQENAAEKFWWMADASAGVRHEIAELQRKLDRLVEKRRAKERRQGEEVNNFLVTGEEKRLSGSIDKLMRVESGSLEHLHPELWVRWTILSARSVKDQNVQGGWREDVRAELVRLVPRTVGRQLDYDATHVLFVFSQCLWWIDKNRKNLGHLKDCYFQTAPSRSERAYILTALVLKASGYARHPGAKQIKKIVKSSKLTANETAPDLPMPYFFDICRTLSKTSLCFASSQSAKSDL